MGISRQINVREKCYKAAVVISVVVVAGCINNHHASVNNVTYVNARSSTYTVRRGDTLYSVALRFQKDYQELARINGITEPFIIYPGQSLRLRSGTIERSFATKNNNNNIANNREREYDKSKQIIRKSAASQSNSRSERILTPVNRNDARVWLWPCEGKIVSRYSAGKVERNGVDIFGKYGSPVRAAASGRVVYSGGGLVGYGNLIIIEHDGEFLSAYAHNSKLISKENDYVKAGQKIAELGSSGTSQPKLHLEIRHKGMLVDPLRYFPKEKM